MPSLEDLNLCLKTEPVFARKGRGGPQLGSTAPAQAGSEASGPCKTTCLCLLWQLVGWYVEVSPLTAALSAKFWLTIPWQPGLAPCWAVAGVLGEVAASIELQVASLRVVAAICSLAFAFRQVLSFLCFFSLTLAVSGLAVFLAPAAVCGTLLLAACLCTYEWSLLDSAD